MTYSGQLLSLLDLVSTDEVPEVGPCAHFAGEIECASTYIVFIHDSFPYT